MNDKRLFLYAIPLDEANEAGPGVAGTYMCRVPESVPESMLAAAALDSFRDVVPIDAVEEWSFVVTDARGNEMGDPDDADMPGYSPGDLADMADITRIGSHIPEDIRLLAELNAVQDEH